MHSWEAVEASRTVISFVTIQVLFCPTCFKNKHYIFYIFAEKYIRWIGTVKADMRFYGEAFAALALTCQLYKKCTVSAQSCCFQLFCTKQDTFWLFIPKMASLDDTDDQSLLDSSISKISHLSAEHLSNVQIRRRLTQEFNFDCGPVNNSTRKVLLKKLERLENERSILHDSFTVTPYDEEEKEKENVDENNHVNGKEDDISLLDKSFGLKGDEDLIQSTLNDSPKKVSLFFKLYTLV